MRILITGATGTVGRNVIEQLIALDPDRPNSAPSPATPKQPSPKASKSPSATSPPPQTLADAFKDVDAVHFINFAGEQYAPLTDAEARSSPSPSRRRPPRAPSSAAAPTAPLERPSPPAPSRRPILHPVEFMSNTLMWWAGAIKAEGAIREPFGDRVSAMVHPADIGAVAAKVLLDGGRDGRVARDHRPRGRPDQGEGRDPRRSDRPRARSSSSSPWKRPTRSGAARAWART